MPAPPTELKQTEKLQPITTGSVEDYAGRHAEAAGAVERGNTRINGWRTFYACVKAAVSAGTTPATCL
jgi:hypothetical protein